LKSCFTADKRTSGASSIPKNLPEQELMFSENQNLLLMSDKRAAKASGAALMQTKGLSGASRASSSIPKKLPEQDFFFS
jgi:hypothetical protein